VVVPATDAPPTLDRCLRALHTASGPVDELLPVPSPSGLGPAAARNRGAGMASGDVLVFVDADVVVRPDALERIRAAFRSEPRLGAVFGAYDSSPERAELVSSFRNLLHHHVHSTSPGAATTFWAGLGAVRRDALADVGGFDADRYPTATIEDIDLGERLKARGWPVALDPRIRGTHLKRWTLTGMVRGDFSDRGRPWTALRLRSGSASTALNLGWRHRASAVACVAAVGAAPRRPLAAPALGWSALMALNHGFYGLLARRLGPLGLLAGPGLHALHHLTAVAAVGAGVLDHWFERVRRRGGEPR
jgi:hypothetical protein